MISFLKKNNARNLPGNINKPLFDFNLNILDPTGETVEAWKISVKEILAIDFGGCLDYQTDGIAITTLILRPENCVLVNSL